MASPIQLVLFGPQQPRWTHERLQTLQTSLVTDPSLRFLQICLEELDVFLDATPLARIVGAAQPVGLVDFARGGQIPQPDTLANAQLAVLTVVYQTIEWHRFATAHGHDGAVVQGFCIGFLTAAVASCTTDSHDDFELYAASAIRLAACVGLIVDAEDAAHSLPDQATIISVRCHSLSDRTMLAATLDSFDQTYISCVTDDRTLTVTVPNRHLEALTSRLDRESIPVVSIGLTGSYHHPKHSNAAQQLKEICAETLGLQLPSAEHLRRPLRSTAETELITSGLLHEIAIELILCKRANWFQTVKSALKGLPSHVQLVSVGTEAHIPPSLSNARNLQSETSQSHHEEIAVIGMSCRFPQADTLEEFWELISSGKTAFGSLPATRFDPASLWREPNLPEYWGNFLRKPDVFDHRFFGISGREAKSMDPQQRLALQVAYEAMESAGYCSLPSVAQEKNVGCYLGVGAVDYEGNIASENANAFSATGTLRAFIPGRISHFFGWTGPSITFDTACSSSAVAISSACKVNCSMAIAGGVNVITSPNLHQNLSAASFLNPSTTSRAFDASAAGYCRGEGAGVVVLKPLSKAIEAGDNILAVIAGSAINQSSNVSPITVPDSQSQSALYQRALKSARLDPMSVQYVEAHGTGTQVGDPIEYESVKLALTGNRDDRLSLGSVKDNIGHAEAASGAAGIVKVILMMQKRKIPKQANFVTLNPRITPSDMIQVPMATQLWHTSRPVALLNNYGASGNNAAVVLRGFEHTPCTTPEPGIYPMVISAKSHNSLKAYLNELKSFTSRADVALQDISYSLARRQNPTFEYRVAFMARSTADMVTKLDHAIVHANVSASPSDECAAICRELGLPDILSDIFSGKPIQDLVQLHCMLLAMQISYARTWIDCGMQINSMIGHSFGQISALCVANSISTRDAFRFIGGRARLICDKWGPDCGAMMSIECDRSDLETLVSRINASNESKVDIACYNGPRSFVLAGNTPSVDKLEGACYSFKTTRLRNTHAFHSYAADSIMDELKDLARSIVVRSPDIHVETCSRDGSQTVLSAMALSEHTREPVYFSDAVQRLAARLPSAVWLEAGSETPVISMARRALAQSTGAHKFLPAEFGTDNPVEKLAEVSCQLWSAGIRTRLPFWPFYGRHRADHVNLPPYQFEQTKHWIPYDPSPASAIQPTKAPIGALVSMVGGMDHDGGYTFAVDTSNTVFELATSGHAVAGQSLCPASMYIEIVARSAILLLDSVKDALLPPYIEDLVMSAPLGFASDLFLRLLPIKSTAWVFTIFSNSSISEITEHGKGRIHLPNSGDVVYETQLKLLQRMITTSSIDRVMNSPAATSIGGPIIYQLFSEIVEYKSYYRAVKSVSALGNEAVGHVDISEVAQPINNRSTLCNPIELDNFLQVAGIHINCLSSRRKSEVFMCTAIDEVILAPSFGAATATTKNWKVYSRYERVKDGVVTNNIFVYDFTDKLVAAMTGVTFRSVNIKSLVRSLSRVGLLSNPLPIIAKEDVDLLQADSGYQSTSPVMSIFPEPDQDSQPVSRTEAEQPRSSSSSEPESMLTRLRSLLSDVIEVPLDEVAPSSSLENLGIDSLLVTEVLWEIQQRLNIRVTQEQIMGCEDVLSLSDVIEGQTRPHVTPSSASSGSPAVTEVVRVEDAAVSKSTRNFGSLAQECFSQFKSSYDTYAERTGFSGFYAGPFVSQSQLVLRYVVDAFEALGCGIENLPVGENIPIIPHVEAHQNLIPQLYMILEDAGLVARSKDGSLQRTEIPVPSVATSSLLSELLKKYPQHTSEMKLLHTTGHQLADCLSGSVDPISLIFRDASARALLEDVYTNAPMFKAGTLLLAQYLSSVVARSGAGRKLKILELGGGTGGTTKEIVATLANLTSGSELTYTFTDLSSSLVASARKKFSQWSFMRYSVLDIEKLPDPEHLGQYDIIISTNCIHATHDLTRSTTHIQRMLRPDGILCLIELTRNLFWFDLVFGLLSGWWLFNDGRTHVLADENRWKRSLSDAGFQWVDWSDGPSEESNLLRLITASPSAPPTSLVQKETVTFKRIDGLDLEADIYFPAKVANSEKPLPIALMIHGGGHVMLSRDDIRPNQTELLLQHGFLPISIDYRLCPEVALLEGPMSDVADALQWARTVLPSITLSRNDVRVDGSQVVAVGWSTGGTLALSLGWTSMERRIAPPEAILVFYSPLDYEDPFWMQPNIPLGSEASTTYELDETIWDAVREQPMTRWNVSPSKRALGGWMTPSDPRSRLALYMNYHGRTLHVLLNGLDPYSREAPVTPTEAEIQAVSPLAQVRNGTFHTPTFVVHPTEDDLIPWAQAERMEEALRQHGVESHLRLVDGVPHLFDMYREYQKQERLQEIIREGYKFLLSHVS
ncbi:ketoacyl-synt-domain-containing protein [Paraphaeosphaeria sporulosa]|uniref:Ketoacyl-synt-domain-containing protein n=1 Tax=Paraphaeosphaeria sporulosa TaxID=1460663 RepID=A0A177CVZ6_9PLEO|nr:ketoacyl-synt-domain-containing protein [Paraphaeosphaeria sporulosa]OAG11208.1 ketoacyl-synt-domain-containing protein [Paraphaeosphaeria sporulosa]